MQGQAGPGLASGRVAFGWGVFPWCVRNVNLFVFVERKECQITCFCGVRNCTLLVSMARKEDDLT